MSVETPVKKCRICNTDTTPHLLNQEKGHLKNYDIYYCKDCNIYIRELNPHEIEKYLDNRKYTQPKNEAFLKQNRDDFFNHIINITRKYITPATWLDFGCAYGHLIEKVQKLSIRANGVELYKQTHDLCIKKNLCVFHSMNEIPPDQHYDVISAIDSFYYVQNPVSTITSFHSHLTGNGILILRISNRNWLIKLFKLLNIQSLNAGMSDSFISYSTKSISRLLQTNGFRILKIQYAEKGKHHPFMMRTFYKLTTILSMISLYKWPITPGIIIVAMKNQGEY